MKARDEQVGGDHYENMGAGPWDVVDTWPLEQRIGYYRGGALKYIMCVGTKDENAMEIRKGAHYLRKLAEVLDEGRQGNYYDELYARLDEIKCKDSQHGRDNNLKNESQLRISFSLPVFNSLTELHDAGYRLISSRNDPSICAILNGMIVNIIKKSNDA